MARRHGIVSAEAGRDLTDVMHAIDNAPAHLEKLIEDTSAEQLSNAWVEELVAGGGSAAQQAFITREAFAEPVRHGLIVHTGSHELTRPYEFGTNNRDALGAAYERKNLKAGGTHTVTRRTRRQLPERKEGGWLAYPSANRLGSRVFSMWAQLLHKIVHDAYEGKS